VEHRPVPKTRGLVLALVFAVLAAGALPAAGARDAAAPVNVTMSEFKFVLSKKTVRRGTVVFRVTNGGQISHDFKIGGKKTPVLAAGSRANLTVTFRRAGRYPYLCTLPSHAAAGMKGVVVVR
jgi:plastocyanin